MILVFGHSGQVATELRGILPDAKFAGRDQIDLSKEQNLDALISNVSPEGIINAAAYSAVDRAEREEAAALKLNAHAPEQMAKAARRLNIPLVHISTDYVFDGNGERAYAPDASTGPLGVYGHSKLKGELAIRASGANYAILRTSWVFSEHGSNFVKTMIRLSETKDRLSIVVDQVGGPTPAKAIAEACNTILQRLRLEPELAGTYHFSGAPDVSRAAFAREIFSQAHRRVVVDNIPTSQYPTPAKRPLNSRLDCRSLSMFGLTRPDWKAGLKETLRKLKAIS